MIARFSFLFFVLLSFASAATNAALPFLSPLFGEHMMLQRGKTNRLWGWAKPGEEIRIAIAGQEIFAVTGRDGRWQAEFIPPPAGGPYVLKIDGPQSLEFRDVLVGDLWLCSGQSNMEVGLTRALHGEEDAKAANFPNLRLFRVAQKAAYNPAAVPQGSWQVCAPEIFTTGGGFSAVAYYFGRKVHQETGIPIGLISDAVGGSPAESWMSPAALGAFPEFKPLLAETERLQKLDGPVYGNFVMHWYDEFDRGVAGDWGNAELDVTGWKSVSLKEGFAQLGVASTPAVVWFRREIILPDPLPTGQAKLLLGVIEKMDTAFINGKWIGASAWVENPRAYNVPADALHPGRNIVAIRVLKTAPDGGFRSPADTLKLTLSDGTTIPLEGEWHATISVDAKPPHPLPLGYENWPTMPTVLYQGMLQPIAPIALTGALWYQGEGNFQRAAQYRTLLPALIADWLSLFGQPNLPFYIVSLPAFMQRRDKPGTDGWTDLREAQALTAATIPHTGIAITIDTGDANDIHPKDKLPVGERLALLALKNHYGKNIVAEGPTFARFEKIANTIQVHFTHTDGGLVVKGEKLGEFSLAGADHVWHWADAKIDGDTVIVSSPAVPEPVAVRYAWQANPLATLYNGAGLPAAPFRSDNWEP